MKEFGTHCKYIDRNELTYFISCEQATSMKEAGLGNTTLRLTLKNVPGTMQNIHQKIDPAVEILQP